MHPAPSVILFTTLSGAGYGLLISYCLAAMARLPMPGGWFGAVVIFAGGALAATGFMFSLLHLKHPERAWRAVSQWRSSWLSREGASGLLTFVPIGLLLLHVSGVWEFGRHAALWLYLSTLAGSVVVVLCTGMIYASLRPIRQWYHPAVAPLYLLFSLQSGALLLTLLTGLAGTPSQVLALSALGLTALGWGVKQGYWQSVDRRVPTTSANTAIGLEGEIKAFEAPHTEENYLLTEMGYRLARKHAVILRQLALLLGAGLPGIGLAYVLIMETAPVLVIYGFVMVSMSAGLLIERWLFFAEATHTQMLYYDPVPQR